MKYLLLILLSLLLTTWSASAQSFSGTVVDKNNKAISYGLVYSKNHNTHAHTTDDGRFMIEKATIGDTLEISHLSFKTNEYIITDMTHAPTIILEEENISLNEIVISNQRDAISQLTEINLLMNPINSSQEVLRAVPGLFIGQHAGGGKAEQIFLRGFDLDHGTDISISTDGIPVNMVSHAHGQGYADLHYVIPETIDKIDLGLGPHHADQGNFTTAGYVDLKTKRSLDNSLVKLEIGQNQTNRFVTLLDLLSNDKSNGYIAAEHMTTNGPFLSPQNFVRTNVFGKYSNKLSEKTNLTLTVSHFNSQWDASGQIPQRQVDNGSITRFGAIDDTEGGITSRSNVILDYDKFLSKSSQLKTKLFASKYDFELYSNFTFFLEDPVNGDQIKQKENRFLYGVTSEYLYSTTNSIFDTDIKAGVSLRSDFSRDNQLAHTKNKTTILENIRLGNVTETNLGGYLEAALDFGKFMVIPSARVDNFHFGYEDLLSVDKTSSDATQSIFSPKLGLYYTYSDKLQVFGKFGKGFHSNDSRVSSTTASSETLPGAYGYDFGAIWKSSNSLFLSVTYWNLNLDQEFVYVGDAGIVEPSGRSSRKGLDLAVNYQPKDWILWTTNFNYTKPRSLDDPEGQNYIPLAPSLTLMSGIGITHPSGITSQVNLRHIGDRPATEDYAITAEGYTVVDLNLGYNLKNMHFGLQFQNLLNTEWNETQFATESRLQNEANSVTEIHFTPGIPFFMKGSLEFRF